MVCLGFEPGPQDGRRRRNHGAMAATPLLYFLDKWLRITLQTKNLPHGALLNQIHTPEAVETHCEHNILATCSPHKFTYKFNPVKQISNRAAAIAQWFNLPLPPVAAGSNPKHTIYTVFQFALLNL